MKVAITGDVHAHPFSDYATLDEHGINSRLQRTVDCLRWMLKTSVARGCKKFIIGGDLFHSRKDVPTIALDMVGQALKDYADQIEIILLRGNHDMNTSTEHNSLVPFRGMARVIDKRTLDKDSKIGFIPWTDNQKVAKRSFEKLKEEGARYIVGHMGVDGAKLGPLNLEVPGHLVLDEDSGIGAFKWVVLSHYHKHQKLEESPGNVWYVGSPLQHGWGEWGEVKGFFIADESKLTFIENVDSPRFIKVTDETDMADIRPTDYVKIIARSEEDVTALRDKVKKTTKVEDESTMKTEVTVHKEVKQRLDLSGIENRKMLIRYIKHVGVPDGFTKSELADAGSEILQGEIA